MNTPKLYTDTYQLFKLLKAQGGIQSMRTHSDFARTLEKGLDELVESGVVVLSATQWTANGQVVAEETYHREDGKSFTGIAFGSWFCLAMALKVNKPEVRQALSDYLKKNPIY
ncbi:MULTISPECIES: hypothetical protein [Pseudomonas]|uniref:hypothetical protein n=1 Tax=Pseudomonas TaxID=286 RepID=UPI00387AABF1